MSDSGWRKSSVSIQRKSLPPASFFRLPQTPTRSRARSTARYNYTVITLRLAAQRRSGAAHLLMWPSMFAAIAAPLYASGASRKRTMPSPAWMRACIGVGSTRNGSECTYAEINSTKRGFRMACGVWRWHTESTTNAHIWLKSFRVRAGGHAAGGRSMHRQAIRMQSASKHVRQLGVRGCGRLRSCLAVPPRRQQH